MTLAVTSALRILLLEDEPRDADLIQEQLEGEGFGCETTLVQTRAEFLAALENANSTLSLRTISCLRSTASRR